jgi:AraC-like DNA-binding protein
MHKQATVRVGPLTNIPYVLELLGYEPKSLLAATGFRLEQFEDPDSRISFLAGSKLIARCVEVTKCHHFGLLLGKHANPSHLGIAGFQLSSAPDVGTALSNLIKCLDLHDEGGSATLTTTEDTTLFGYVINEPDIKAARQIYDLSMVVACKIMRALCGEKWNPSEVLLMHKKPDTLTLYKEFFRSQIRFNSQTSALVFNKGWLHHKIPSADPLLQRHLQQVADELHLKQPKDFIFILQQQLRHSLANQQVSVVDIARQLGMHERTLHRRLKIHGTNFHQELEQTRYTISRQLLTETNESNTNIAITLGYSNVSAFSRAFKKWSGESPAKWRKKVI